MPYLNTPEDVPLPFGGTDVLSKESSLAGARAVQIRAGSQCDRLLQLYRQRGPVTDHEARRALRLPLSTINARRNTLVARGLVRATGTKPGPWGVPNTVYEAV